MARPPLGRYKENLLAKPNYSFEKRQRELAKKKKQEQKLEQKRLQRESKNPAEVTQAGDAGADTPPAPAESGAAP